MHFNDHLHYFAAVQYSQDFEISDLATVPTAVDCGQMVVSFAYRQGGDLDSSIFNVDMVSSPNKFDVF